MKRFINYMLAALAVCALTGVAASAKVRSKSITLNDDVVVAGTNIRKGDYTLKFDEQSGELSIVKGRKIIVKTTAHVERLEGKAAHTSVITKEEGQNRELTGFAFSGDNHRIIIGDGSGATMSER